MIQRIEPNLKLSFPVFKNWQWKSDLLDCLLTEFESYTTRNNLDRNKKNQSHFNLNWAVSHNEKRSIEFTC